MAAPIHSTKCGERDESDRTVEERSGLSAFVLPRPSPARVSTESQPPPRIEAPAASPARAAPTAHGGYALHDGADYPDSRRLSDPTRYGYSGLSSRGTHPHPDPRVAAGTKPFVRGRTIDVIGRSAAAPTASAVEPPIISSWSDAKMVSTVLDEESTKLIDPVAAVTNANFQEFSKHFTPAEFQSYTTYRGLSRDELRCLCAKRDVVVKPDDDKMTLATKYIVGACPSKWHGVVEKFAYPAPPSRSSPIDSARESTKRPFVSGARCGDTDTAAVGARADAIAFAKAVFHLKKDGYSEADAIAIVKISMAPAAAEAAPPVPFTGDCSGYVHEPKIMRGFSWKGVASTKQAVAARPPAADEHAAHFYIFRPITESWAVHWEDGALEAAYQRFLAGIGPTSYNWRAQKPGSDPRFPVYDLMTVHFERCNAMALADDKDYKQFECTKNRGEDSAPLVRGVPERGMIMGYHVIL